MNENILSQPILDKEKSGFKDIIVNYNYTSYDYDGNTAIIDYFDSRCEKHNKISKIYFIKYSIPSIIIFVFLNILTFGIISLSLSWFESLQYIFLYKKCSLKQAKKVMIIDYCNKYNYVDLLRYKDNNNEIIVFSFRLFRYILNKNEYSNNSFIPIKYDLPEDSTKNVYHNCIKGLSSNNYIKKNFIYSKCNFDFEISSVIKLLILEITDPFYLFQVGSIVLWFNNNYVKYAVVIIIMTVVSIIYAVYETRVNLLQIKKMSKYSIDVVILRDGNFTNMTSDELVPGDVYIIPQEGTCIPADSCVLSGSIIVNEALLTGESTPVIKECINKNDNSLFTESDAQKHTVFAGTKIIQRRGNCLAVVTSTGFNTEKGTLLRSILHPKQEKTSFEKESVKYIILMGIVGIVGYGISLIIMINTGELSIKEMIFKFFDLITIVVPPALPACLMIGISLALVALKKKKINCIDRSKVNLVGMTNLICFDKTGTLTEDYLEIVGFKQNKLTSKGFSFSNYNLDTSRLSNDIFEEYKYNSYTSLRNNSADLDLDTYKENMFNNKNDKNLLEEYFHYKRYLIKKMFVECLATCHTLTKVKDEILGDPIDVKMFEKSTWKMLEEEQPLTTNVLDNNFMFKHTNKDNIQSNNRIKSKLIKDKNLIKQDNQSELADKITSNSTSFIPNQENLLSKKLEELYKKENIKQTHKVYNSNDKSNDVEVDFEEEENNIIKSHYEVNVIKRYNFSSKLQRMTVITKNNNDSNLYVVFSKGSPEKISSLCNKMTLPEDYDRVLNEYTAKGFRVLAMAGKKIKMNYSKALSIERDKIESNMIFLGLIIVQNKLKQETVPTLKLLSDSKLKMVMATGDNILTAIAVSRESGLINPTARVYSCTISDKNVEYLDENPNISKSNKSKRKYLRYILEWEGVSNLKTDNDDNENKLLIEANKCIERMSFYVSNNYMDKEDHDISEANNTKRYSFINFNNNNNNNNYKKKQYVERSRCPSLCYVEESNVEQFYKYLQTEEADEVETHDKTININNNQSLSDNNNSNNKNNDYLIKAENINQTDISLLKENQITQRASNFTNNNDKKNDNYNDCISEDINYDINVNLDNLPFEKDNQNENHVIVTNGYSLEKLYNLSRVYLKTKNQSFKIYYDTMRIILRKGYIFARMSPENKAILVEAFKEEEFNVLMCGDGANDCAALKCASVGVSLSQEEASMAAPFTSKVPDISCIINLLIEGKASLVTSFQSFKFIIMYSLIQFTSTTILNVSNSYLTDNQFLVSDLFMIVPLTFLMSWVESDNKLTKDIPVSSLFSFSVIITIFFSFIVHLIFQLAPLLVLNIYNLFNTEKCGFIGVNNDPIECDINTTAFFSSNIQYVISCLCISLTVNFKKKFYTCKSLCAFIIITTVYSFSILFYRDSFAKSILNVIQFEKNYYFINFYLATLIGVNILMSLLCEIFVIRKISKWWADKKIKHFKESLEDNEEHMNLSTIHQTITKNIPII